VSGEVDGGSHLRKKEELKKLAKQTSRQRNLRNKRGTRAEKRELGEVQPKRGKCPEKSKSKDSED